MGKMYSSVKGTKFFVEVLRRDPCVFCGKYYKLPKSHKKAGKLHNTVDHIHPRAHGGKNTWLNYGAACPDCNTRKSDNSLLGHLLGVQMPCREVSGTGIEMMPETWYDPLGILDEPKVDERFVGLGARERKVLRAKLADAS